MTVPMIPFAEGEKTLDWIGLTQAFEAGHRLGRAEIGDTFLYRDPDTLLSRAAWIIGLPFAGLPGNTVARQADDRGRREPLCRW